MKEEDNDIELEDDEDRELSYMSLKEAELFSEGKLDWQLEQKERLEEDRELNLTLYYWLFLIIVGALVAGLVFGLVCGIVVFIHLVLSAVTLITLENI